MRRGALAAASALLALFTLAFPDPADAERNNILLIILDDVGVDMIGAYKSKGIVASQQVPDTMTIDALAAQGVTFSNVWANPICSPTRATIQTGRFGYRDGIFTPGESLPVEDLGIADVLNSSSSLVLTNALFGKWGLNQVSVIDDVDVHHVVRSGYDYFAGKIDCCIGEGYLAYEKLTAEFDASRTECDASNPPAPADYQKSSCINCPAAGRPGPCNQPPVINTYATTQNVDDTIAWIKTWVDASPEADDSWFVTLAFNASHTPFHGPPPGLWRTAAFDPTPHIVDETTRNCDQSDLESNQDCYRAAVEAADIEIERLLAATDGESGPLLVDPADTTVIVVGDNGSVGIHDGGSLGVSVDPFDRKRAKQTLYEGGINVPLIVAWKGVTAKNRVSDALVNTSDLFATVLELAGVDLAQLPADPSSSGSAAPDHDSYSLAPILNDDCSPTCAVESIREYAYAEIDHGDRVGKTIRNRLGYKLIFHDNPFGYKDDDGSDQLLYASSPGWELYYLGGDPGSPLPEPVGPVENVSGNLVDPNDPDDAVLVDTLSMSQKTYLQPILDDLREKIGRAAAGTGPALAAAGKCDVNGDGRIDTADALLAAQMVKTGAGVPREAARADVAPPNDLEGGDGDGVVSGPDLLLILRALSGDDVKSCDHTLI